MRGGGDAESRTLAGQPAEQAWQPNNTKRGTTMSAEQPPKKLASDVFSAAMNRALDEFEASLRASLPGPAAEVAVVIMRLAAVAVLMPPVIVLMILEEFGSFLRAISEPFLVVAQAMFSALFSSKPNKRD